MPAETMGYEEPPAEATTPTPREKQELTKHDWELYLEPRIDGGKVDPRLVERLNTDLDKRVDRNERENEREEGKLTAAQRARIGEQTQATVAWHLRQVESSWLDTLAVKVKQPGAPVEDPTTMAAILEDMAHLAREKKESALPGQPPTWPDQLRRRIAANREKLSGNDQHLLQRVAWTVKGTAEGVARDTYNEGYPIPTGIIVGGMDSATKAHFDQAQAWLLAKDPNQLSELQKEQKQYPDDVRSIFGDFAFYRKDLNGKVKLHHRKPKVTIPEVGAFSLS